jgi:adenylate cyclase
MIEIERKFLLKNLNFLKEIDAGFEIRQAYVMEAQDRSLRVRIKNERAFLTGIMPLSARNLSTKFHWERLKK